jgi:hypothetical protein
MDFATGQPTTATIKVEAVGAAIKSYVDGVEKNSVTDSTFTAAGRAGFYADSAGTLVMDNYEVSNQTIATVNAAGLVNNGGLVQ